MSIANEDGGTDAGATKDSSTRSDGAPVTPPIRLAAGSATACALLAIGAVRCWGNNFSGQHGIGTHDGDRHPTPSPPVTGLVAEDLDSSGPHTCARAGNAITCWGSNTGNQLGHPRSVEEAQGDAGLCSGQPCARSPVTIPSSTGAKGIATGQGFSCAVINGSPSCWGTASRGALGLVDGGRVSATPSPLAFGDAVEIKSGSVFSCARKGVDGTVWCWGEYDYGDIGRAADAGAAAPGWDTQDHPIPRQVEGLVRVRSLGAGHYHACAILADKTVSCWGFNPTGQLGHDPGTDRTCGGASPSPCNDVPTKVPGLAGARKLALGYYHSCALLENDTVVCWGSNELGRLGHDPSLDDAGSRNVVVTPKPVMGLSNVADVAAGYSYTCASTWDRKVYCWGADSFGEAGSLDGGSSFVPVQVKGL
ncbi:RCC1 domain-containing protein [Pendulispora albinea]|uniref:RCC1-like domain-containing protein n=1 Tax=Pendulispora albinea TaxID=2741071 RepID=A0ABZ2LW57_9BACT